MNIKLLHIHFRARCLANKLSFYFYFGVFHRDSRNIGK